VYERATVRRREQDDVARVEESVRRERLTVATDGHANVVEDSADERPTRGNGED
jgi:stress response protein YsnF